MKRILLLFIVFSFLTPKILFAGESVRNVVVLEGSPLALASPGLMAVEDKKLDKYFAEFSESLLKVIPTARIIPDSLTRFAIHSVVVEVPKERMELLKFVKSVVSFEPDRLIKITAIGNPVKIPADIAIPLMNDSVSLVGANVMHDRGFWGNGIRIAVVDTGIDWTHPDLGSGFGPDYKVEKAINTMSPLASALDDNGHGTHVSAIAAGVHGVAPEAKLWAIKVLTKDGVGYISWILKGIDRALDFDNDPKTFDRADVLSLSLGGDGGSPFDTMSEALSSAMLSGVVVTVAAGNSGPLYKTISSPGTSRWAITVGASKMDDSLPDFSSAGPVVENSSVKPDIMAPGFEITSAIPGNGYATWSGTSMATPHVAGAAALVKEYLITKGETKISALKIKSLLLLSSKNINFDMFYQGYGRLQVDAVDQVPITFDNMTLTFGPWLGGKKGPNFYDMQKLIVENSSNSDISASLIAGKNGDWKKGGVLEVTPPKLDLKTGEESEWELGLYINTKIGAPGLVGAFRFPLLLEVNGWSKEIPSCVTR